MFSAQTASGSLKIIIEIGFSMNAESVATDFLYLVSIRKPLFLN